MIGKKLSSFIFALTFVFLGLNDLQAAQCNHSLSGDVPFPLSYFGTVYRTNTPFESSWIHIEFKGAHITTTPPEYSGTAISSHLQEINDSSLGCYFTYRTHGSVQIESDYFSVYKIFYFPEVSQLVFVAKRSQDDLHPLKFILKPLGRVGEYMYYLSFIYEMDLTNSDSVHSRFFLNWTRSTQMKKTILSAPIE